MGKKSFYVVKEGAKVGIFNNWPECQAAVKGYKGAVFKGFETLAEALEWQDSGEKGTSSIFKASNKQAESFKVDFDVYTDGSYQKGKYSYGYVFIKDGQVIFECNGVGEDPEAAKMRNVAGEIAAVQHAVEKAETLDARIRIFHDYSGISLWVSGDWQAKNKYTQAYVTFMRAHQGRYEFKKVAGHSGDQYNDYADRLAKQALGINTK